MKPEQRFWSTLRGVLPPGFWSRVENPCDPGMPDVFFHLDEDAWMELKAPDRLPMTDRHGLLPSQKLWIRRYLRHNGRRVLIAVYYLRVVHFVPGRYFKTINYWPLDTYSVFPSATIAHASTIDHALRLALTSC